MQCCIIRTYTYISLNNGYAFQCICKFNYFLPISAKLRESVLPHKLDNSNTRLCILCKNLQFFLFLFSRLSIVFCIWPHSISGNLSTSTSYFICLYHVNDIRNLFLLILFYVHTAFKIQAQIKNSCKTFFFNFESNFTRGKMIKKI